MASAPAQGSGRQSDQFHPKLQGQTIVSILKESELAADSALETTAYHSTNCENIPPSSEANYVNALEPAHQAVRFSSVNQEIEPAYSLQANTSSNENVPPTFNETLSPEAQEEIRSISRSLQNTHLQQRRMSNFAFEPVSLPVSRVGHDNPRRLCLLILSILICARAGNVKSDFLCLQARRVNPLRFHCAAYYSIQIRASYWEQRCEQQFHKGVGYLRCVA